MRIVWRGGDASVFDVPATVGSLSALSRHEEMEIRVLEGARASQNDAEIAAELSAAGFRSPMRKQVLPSTVRGIRLRHGILQVRSQSHPRRIPGYLTIPQLAARLGVTKYWIYDRIHNGTIVVLRDEGSGLYLFPDTPDTLTDLQKLRTGEVEQLTFQAELAS